MNPVVKVRSGRIREFADMVRAASQATTDTEMAFCEGTVTGWAAATLQSDTLSDALVDARNTHFVKCAPYEEAIGVLHMLPGTEKQLNDTLRASGVLWGYKQATAEEEDAAECSFCAVRILTDRDTDAEHCDDHGWFDTYECRRNLCPVNRRACWGDEG